MTEENHRPNATVAALIVILIGIILLTGLARDKPREPVRDARIGNPAPHEPAIIFHPPGATNLDPGLNTNPSNDPTPAAFQLGTGTDPFDGQTGEGSGPEGTRRTAAIHEAFTQVTATKQPTAAAGGNG